MRRLFILLAALAAVLAAPLVAPAIAAAAPMEHCDDSGQASPASAPGDQSVMNHQSCCVAVDPGESGAVNANRAPTRLTAVRPIDDRQTAFADSGTDPPPPRLA